MRTSAQAPVIPASFRDLGGGSARCANIGGPNGNSSDIARSICFISIAGRWKHHDASVRTVEKNRSADGPDGSATANRMAAPVSISAAENEPRLACPFHRLPHATLAYGGLSKATQRRLIALTKELRANGGIVSDPGPRARPGSRLVREWRGRTHTVVVREDGFEYAGKPYSSLSKIAQAITGARIGLVPVSSD